MPLNVRFPGRSGHRETESDRAEISRDADPDPRLQSAAGGLEWVAWLMDRSLKIPGTRITLGLDALLGLFPVGGDVLTGLVQAGLVLVALYRYRVPRTVAARMAANVLIDTVVGAIPVIGDMFDVAFKANTRNIRLLEPYRREGQRSDEARSTFSPAYRILGAHPAPPRARTPWRYLLPIAGVLTVAVSLMLVGFVTLVRWMIG